MVKNFIALPPTWSPCHVLKTKKWNKSMPYIEDITWPEEIRNFSSRVT